MLRIANFLPQFRARPRPVEQAILDELARVLPAEAQVLMHKQMAQVNRIDRQWKNKEVRFYRLVRGRQTHDPTCAFPNTQDELLLATVSFATPGKLRARTEVDIWLVRGFIFSLEFSKSPSEFKDLRQLPDAKITVRVDPMATPEALTEGVLDPSKLHALFAANLPGYGAVESAKAPIDGARRKLENQWQTSFPPDFMELLDVADGVVCAWGLICGLRGVRQIVLDGRRFLSLAEIEDAGFIGVEIGVESNRVYQLLHDAPFPPKVVGVNLWTALEKVLSTKHP